MSIENPEVIALLKQIEELRKRVSKLEKRVFPPLVSQKLSNDVDELDKARGVVLTKLLSKWTTRKANPVVMDEWAPLRAVATRLQSQVLFRSKKGELLPVDAVMNLVERAALQSGHEVISGYTALRTINTFVHHINLNPI